MTAAAVLLFLEIIDSCFLFYTCNSDGFNHVKHDNMVQANL